MNDPAGPFADVPRDARGHLGLLFYEAAFRVIHHLRCRAAAAERPLDAVFTEYPFLGSYFAEIRRRLPDSGTWGDSLCWLQDACERWEQGTAGWLPLRALREEAGLGREELLALVTIGLVEEESHFASLFASLQEPPGLRRPALGLLKEILQHEGASAVVDAWTLCRALVEQGLAEVVNRDAPRSEWMLRVPAPLWSAVRGECEEQPLPDTQYRGMEDCRPLAELLLSEPERHQLLELQPMLATGQVRLVVLRGSAGSERLEVAGSITQGLGRGVLEASALQPGDGRWALLGPLATLTRTLPVLVLELGPGETFELPPLRGYRGPLVVVAGHEGGLGGAGAESSVTLSLAPESAADRLRHWQAALNGHAAERLAELVESRFLGGRYIRQTARLATTYAALDGRATITSADVRQASRSLNRQQLDTLATRLDEGGAWERLVVHEGTAAELRRLEYRCRYREQLATTLGDDFPGGLNRGVRILFEGPSGTGKTLAARVLASALERDLYRVDLASIVNKYIGETEKNLSRILARAEDLDIVLLLDEGDALLARRTEVRSANERYANLETNYLLQRLETYTGIVIVTTNAGQHIDPAFQRRMDATIMFHRPGPEQRWLLWQLHLPSDHAVEPEALEEVALHYELTGGQIRMAAVSATLLALARPGGRLARRELTEAIDAEYRKVGAAQPGPLELRQVPVIDDDPLDAFLSSIS
jgi:histone H3/H4